MTTYEVSKWHKVKCNTSLHTVIVIQGPVCFLLPSILSLQTSNATGTQTRIFRSRALHPALVDGTEQGKLFHQSLTLLPRGSRATRERERHQACPIEKRGKASALYYRHKNIELAAPLVDSTASVYICWTSTSVSRPRC